MDSAKVRKAIAAAIGALSVWATAAWVPDGHVDRAELVALAPVVLTVAAVWGVKNEQ